MSRALRVAAAALVAAGLVLGIAALSRAPVPHGDEAEAWVRLSWRLRGEGLGECRPLPPEALEGLPAHMRNPEACDDRLPPFRLLLEVDGERVLEREASPAGFRGDGPIHVHREAPLAPGCRTVRVRFAEAADPGAAGERELLRLELEERILLGPGEVVLVTLEGDGRRLRTTGSPCPEDEEGAAPSGPGAESGTEG